MLGLDILVAVLVAVLVGALVGALISRQVALRAKKQVELATLIAEVQSQYVSDSDARQAFYTLLDRLLITSQSDYGYIAEVKCFDGNQTYLKTRALIDTTWAEEVREIYKLQDLGGGMEFHDMQGVLASVVATNKPVYINNISELQRKSPQYETRPITSFMGLPIFLENRLVAVVGLANRAGGYGAAQRLLVMPVIAAIAQIIEGSANCELKQDIESRFAVAKALVNCSNDAIMLLEDGAICDCNYAAEALFHAQKNELIGRSITELSPKFQPNGESSLLALANYVKSLSPGDSRHFNWTVVEENQECIALRASLNRMESGCGRNYLAVVLRNLSLSEHDLSIIYEQQLQIELVLKGSDAGIWDWDVATGQVEVNERWANIIGYTFTELGSVSMDDWRKLCHPDDLPKSDIALQNHWSGKSEYYSIEMRMRHREGHWVWVSDTGRTVQKDESGAAIRMVGTHLDISHVKESESRVEHVSHQLKKFFELSLGFMCIVNVSGHFIKLNAVFLAALGYKEEDILEQPLFNFIHPDDYDYSMDKWLELEQSSCNLRHRFRKRSGQYITLQWSLTPDPDTHHIYATATDVTDTIKLERELSTLSRIAKEVRNGVVITDVNGKIQWVNNSFMRITGYQEHELVGIKPGTLLQGPQSDSTVIAMMSDSLKKHQSFRAEIINYHKTGKPYWIDIDCSPMFDADSVLQGYMAIEVDISAQKNSALELEKQQHLLQQMSELGCIGAWEVDWVTKEIYWSSMTRKIHEVDEDFEPELSTAIYFYKEGLSRQKITEVINEAVEIGQPWQVELQLVTAKGKEIWIACAGKAEFQDGGCVRLFGSIQDIDERKQHQLAHQQSVLHSQVLANLSLSPNVLDGDLVRAAPDILEQCAEVFRADRVSIWLFDQSYSSMRCLSLYEVSTKLFSSGMVLKKSDYPGYFDYLFKHSILNAADAHTHSGSYEFSHTYLKPLGITSLLDSVIFGGGKFVGVFCVEQATTKREWLASEETFAGTITTVISSVVDREQRRKTETQLLKAIDSANSAVQAKSDFLASMSHEIRTPMNGVLGMLGLVLKTPLSSDQLRKITIAQNSAQSLLAIINDILDFSKIDAGKVELESMPFNLHLMLAEFAETMSYRAQEHRLKLSVNLHQVTTPFVIGDPGRLRQILTNLVGNALKFTHQGEVVIDAQTHETDDGNVVFICHVKDTGIGIPANKIAVLFEPFTQVDASNTRQYGGTGLGLSIVKQLCDVMGGRIWVKSEIEKGSCFSFQLQLQKNFTPELTLPSINLSGKRILVVNENSANKAALTEHFSLLGMDVSIANSTAEAMVLCQHACADAMFDVAIIDFLLAGTDGAELGKILKEDPRFNSIALIIINSQPQRGDAVEFANLGFSAYFSCIASPQLLCDAIKVIVDGGLLKYATPLITRHFLESLIRPPLVPAEPSVQWPKNARILLVEDNAINRDVAIDMLSDLGLFADFACNGQEAIQALVNAQATASYALVLMDCQMPVLDGFAATAAIRCGDAGDGNRNIKIIAMTANAMKGDKQRCIESGMNDYLSKPVDPDNLLAVLQKWLLGEADREGVVSHDVRPAIAPLMPSASPFNSAPVARYSASTKLVSPLNAQQPISSPITQAGSSEIEQLQSAVWDLAGALKRVRGRPERLLTLINSYSLKSPEMISDLYQKIESHELTDAAELCHTLKGVAGNLGGTQLLATVQSLESTCLHNDLPEAERLVGELLEHNDQFLKTLSQYRR